MINMKNDIVTTNLRLPRQDWLMIKTLAAEEGKSFNEYIKKMIVASALSVGKRKKEKKVMSIWDLRDVARASKGKAMELSEDDKIIYG